MKKVQIFRTSGGAETLGVMVVDGVTRFVTLELPWKDNTRKISCIPAGSYTVKRYSSAKYPNSWEITGVNGRDSILIHAGNSVKDILGCVLIGMEYGEHCILRSREALEKFNKLMQNVIEFELVIHGL